MVCSARIVEPNPIVMDDDVGFPDRDACGVSLPHPEAIVSREKRRPNSFTWVLIKLSCAKRVGPS
jgi:hypothetical protein